MQGTIVKVLVSEGDAVEAGQAVLVLEAMKMENTINAETAGTVREVRVTEGDTVGTGDVLIVVASSIRRSLRGGIPASPPFAPLARRTLGSAIGSDRNASVPFRNLYRLLTRVARIIVQGVRLSRLTRTGC